MLRLKAAFLATAKSLPYQVGCFEVPHNCKEEFSMLGS